MRWFSWLTGKTTQERKSRDLPTSIAMKNERSQLQGRTYLKDIPDMFPRDMQEVNRLDFQHYMVKTALHGNFIAPLRNPASIIDVGCGTGRWAQEMAQMFSQARVFGLDIDPMVAHTSAQNVPSNYQFVQGNVLASLPYPNASFDYVHQQLLSGSLPAANWPRVVQELVRITRPNGWLELVESDIVVQNAGPELELLTSWGQDTCRRMGVDLTIGSRLDRDLANWGLSNIMTRRANLPIGSWGGRVGRSGTIALTSLYMALKPMITSQLALSPAIFDRTLQAVEKEIEQRQCWAVFFVACGQRVLA